MRLIRRRDHAVLRAEVIGGEATLPILLIEGEPFPPAEAAGYFLAKATAAELAQLRRGGRAMKEESLGGLAGGNEGSADAAGT
jgi:hypothetical protein